MEEEKRKKKGRKHSKKTVGTVEKKFVEDSAQAEETRRDQTTPPRQAHKWKKQEM